MWWPSFLCLNVSKFYYFKHMYLGLYLKVILGGIEYKMHVNLEKYSKYRGACGWRQFLT